MRNLFYGLFLFYSVLTFAGRLEDIRSLSTGTGDASTTLDLGNPELNPQELAALQALPPAAFARLKDTHLNGLSDDAFREMPGASFSVPQLESLRTSGERIRMLTNNQGGQLQSLGLGVIRGMSPATMLQIEANLASFTPTQVAHTSKEQWADPALQIKLKFLDSEIFRAMTGEDAQKLKQEVPGIEAILSGNQLAAFQQALEKAPAAPAAVAAPVAQAAARVEEESLAETPLTPAAVVEAATVAAPDVSDNARDYDANSCVWVEDLPKRVIKARSSAVTQACGARGLADTCVGFVSCSRRAPNSGMKLIRMSSCSASKCGDAVACTKDNARYSVKPRDEDKETVIKSSVRGALER